MTEHPLPEGRPADADADADDLPELELSDNDIIDAMREIDGYLDISTGDFRTIYHLAHRHALERMFKRVAAHKLMRSDFSPLRPETTLDVAARALVAQDSKALPVVDADQSVIGSDRIHDMGYLYVLMPATAGPVLLLGVALLVNNIPKTRRYPEIWL